MKNRTAILVLVVAVVLGIGGGAAWVGVVRARQAHDVTGSDGSATPRPSPSPASPPAPASNDRDNPLGWTITLDGVGPVTIGTPVETIVALGVLEPVAPAERVCDELYRTAAPYRLPDERDGLGIQTVVAEHDSVSYVHVWSPAFATPEGVRVGMSLENVSVIYGSEATIEQDQYGQPVTVLRTGTKVIAFLTYLSGGSGGTSTVITSILVARAEPGLVATPAGC